MGGKGGYHIRGCEYARGKWVSHEGRTDCCGGLMGYIWMDDGTCGNWMMWKNVKSEDDGTCES